MTIAGAIHETAPTVQQQQLEYAQSRSQLLRKDNEVPRVVGLSLGGNDRTSSHRLPQRADRGIWRIRPAAQPASGIKPQRAMARRKAAEPPRQTRQGTCRSDNDAASLIASQLAHGAVQGIELGEPFAAGRHQRKQKAFAIELFEVKALFSKDWAACAGGQPGFVHSCVLQVNRSQMAQSPPQLKEARRSNHHAYQALAKSSAPLALVVGQA